MARSCPPVAVPVGLYLPFPIPPTIFAPAAFSIAVYAQWLAGTSLNVGAAAKAGTAIVALNAAAMTADKILFFCIENEDYLCSQHSCFEAMNDDTVAAGLSIPMHPGAERYFKEVGILK